MPTRWCCRVGIGRFVCPDQPKCSIERGVKDQMPNLPQRLSEVLRGDNEREASIGRRPVPARVVRAVDQGVAVEHGRGIVRAAQARALEYVAEEAMRATGRLSQSE